MNNYITKSNEILIGECIQKNLFSQALIEARENFNFDEISIDHYYGKNFLNNKEYGLLFPKILVDYIYSLSKSKKEDYFFKGFITEKRSWVLKYNHLGTIIHSEYSPGNAYTFDKDYYKQMCENKFVLCPTGNCPWSYRFFEAIMCFSIPIIKDDDLDIFSHKFKYYKTSEIHIYDLDIVNYNYEVFIKNYTLNY